MKIELTDEERALLLSLVEWERKVAVRYGMDLDYLNLLNRLQIKLQKEGK